MQCVHREFSYKSPGERILKIGPHLPKLLSTIKGLSFFWNTVYIIIIRCGTIIELPLHPKGLIISSSAAYSLSSSIGEKSSKIASSSNIVIVFVTLQLCSRLCLLQLHYESWLLGIQRTRTQYC